MTSASETKHTPGPWLDWDTFEWLYEPRRLLTDPANARLMAAAPEMLEALQEDVADFWGDWSEAARSEFRREFPEHRILRAEAAIAKATP